MPHMEHSLGAWFFSCVCVWINVLRRGKLVLPNTLHQPNWLDPLPHTRMALVRIPVRQLEMPIFSMGTDTWGPLSSTQTRHHMYHIWLSAPTTPHHFQLSSSPSRQAPPPPSPDDASLRRRICVAAANSGK